MKTTCLPVETKRPYAFFFHYNKPATQQSGEVKMSVHYRNTCYLVNDVVAKCPTYSRKSKRQPRLVMAGKCYRFRIDKNVAYIE